MREWHIVRAVLWGEPRLLCAGFVRRRLRP